MYTLYTNVYYIYFILQNYIKLKKLIKLNKRDNTQAAPPQ